MSATVSEQLPLLATSPNGIKKLRELILDLAVRGKLVAQNPEDEPASELLKRVAAEKKRLVAEGKIKPSKAVAAISENEKKYELPSGWVWVRIAAIGHDWGQMVPRRRFTYIDVGSVDNNAGLIHDPQVLDADAAPSRARKLVRPGTIVYSTVRPYLLNVAVVEQRYEPEPIASTAFAVVHPHCEMPSRYFFWYLRSPTFIGYVESVQTGIAYPAINDRQFFSGLVPMPPLAEQHRIVAKIDELMALCDQLEAQQADAESAHAQLVATLLDSLTRPSDSDDFAASWQRLSAHFHTLFTTESSIDALKQTLLQLAVMGKLVPQDTSDESASELLKRIAAEKKRLVEEGKIKQPKAPAVDALKEELFSLPKGWEWSNLAQATLVNPRNAAEDALAVSFVPMALIGTSFDGIHGLEPRPWGEVKQGFTHFAEGDIGVAKITPCFENSKACVFSGLTNGLGAGTTELHIIRTLPSTIDARYVLAYVKSPQFLRVGETRMAGTAGQKRLPKNFVETNPLPVPPLAEQNRIVAKLDQLMDLCDKLNATIQQCNQHGCHLADALVDKALSSAPETSTNVVDLSCYLVSRLATKPTFGRTAHMKLIYLADTHLGLKLRGNYMREAAGPLDKSLYRVEEQAEVNGWYTHTSAPLKSGKEKVTYHATKALATKARKFADELGGKRKELDRLISVLGDRNTEELEIVATLFAAWNDALLDGQSPGDDWIIREVRENWHIEKQRFSPDQLHYWLNWMRDKRLVPSGIGRHTQHQTRLL